MLRAPTSAPPPALVLALIPAIALASAQAPPFVSAVAPASAKLITKYINVDLQRAIQLALNLFVQGQQQAQSQIALLESCK